MVPVRIDRRWEHPFPAVVDVVDDKGSGEYKFVKSSKVHSRIIWDCAWTHEGDLFATASRDKTVRMYAPYRMMLIDSHHRSNYGRQKMYPRSNRLRSSR